MRSVINAPDAAKSWLVTEKLPAIQATVKGSIYVETSHLFCKGFIEPILEIGLRPKFIILTRPAMEVAKSLFQINCIPERTSSGRLVLLGPSDPSVLFLPEWEKYNDFQLCYWYALEIERRQKLYGAMFESQGLGAFRVAMQSLTDFSTFKELSSFIVGNLNQIPDEEKFRKIVSKNQNPRLGLINSANERCIPNDVIYLANTVDEALKAVVAAPLSIN
jgi:hypothetical protein